MTPQRESLLQLVEAHGELDGRFSEIRRMGPDGGAGYFSLVFTAFDSITRNRVALKFFNPEFEGDMYRRLSFDREIQLLSELQGRDDVVQLVSGQAQFTETLASATGIAIDVTFRYYAMELASGSVGSAIAYGRWTPAEKLEVFRAACRGVQRLHDGQIVHRDLKPSNFLIFGGRVVRLSDFGTARSLDPASPRLLMSYVAVPPGDYAYTAPEILAGLHDSDLRMAIGADFFALGAILFELFAGTPLAVFLYTDDFANDFSSAMSMIDPSQRRGTFDAVIGSISDAHPLPEMAMDPRVLPGAIRPHVRGLYSSLAELDYRRRLTDFASIFRRIEICEILMRNEAREAARRERRRARRSLTRPGLRS
jgi:serine/threonine protein kinase